MTSERQEFETQMAEIRTAARAVAEGLNETQFNWRPAADRWSVGECLAHLNVTVRAVLPALDQAIATGRSKGLTGNGPFRYGWFARRVAASMEPPVRRRFRTQKIFLPADTRHVPAAVLSEFDAVHDQLAERFARADGLDWGRVRVISPASRWLRLPFGAYTRFTLAHDRRHLWQAQQVREASGFPGA